MNRLFLFLMSAAAITMVACEEDNDYSYPETPESTRQRAQEVADSVNAINAKVDAEISRLKSMYDEAVYAICEKQLEKLVAATIVEEHYQDICDKCGTSKVSFAINDDSQIIESFNCGESEDITVYDFALAEKENPYGFTDWLESKEYEVTKDTPEEEIDQYYEEYRVETLGRELKTIQKQHFIETHNEDICSKCNMASQIYFTIEGTKVMENFTCHGASKVAVYEYKTTFEKWCQQEGYEIPEHAEYVWPLK